MIDLHYSQSGNSLRAVIALEECGLAYRPHIVDLAAKHHKAEPFLALNPFGTVPVMVDHDGPDGAPVTLTQSGAILLYAAEKAGRFLPTKLADRMAVLQWFLLAVSDAQPASMHLLYLSRDVPDFTHHGRRFLEGRLMATMRAIDSHLASGESQFLAGDVSVADFALYPVVRIRRPMIEASGTCPALLAWADRIEARPAVMQAVAR